MATRGYEGVTAADLARMQQKQPTAKPSKYRNVKTQVLGITFDSKREAAEYLRLHAREQCGEIAALRRQVQYALYAPVMGGAPLEFAVVAHYIADFVYLDKIDGRDHVVDAKGKRTAMYQLKKKWLELQSGIVIEEV